MAGLSSLFVRAVETPATWIDYCAQFTYQNGTNAFNHTISGFLDFEDTPEALNTTYNALSRCYQFAANTSIVFMDGAKSYFPDPVNVEFTVREVAKKMVEVSTEINLTNVALAASAVTVATAAIVTGFHLYKNSRQRTTPNDMTLSAVLDEKIDHKGKRL
jgi:hypothetical protein